MKIQNRPTNITQDPLHLSATYDEDDELIRAINNDRMDPNKVWQLSSDPDVGAIDAFWNGVKSDLEKDPNWYAFNDN